MIILNDSNLLAEGGRRKVYINPENNNRLIKIIKEEGIIKKRKKLKFYKKFRFNKVVDENTEDYNAYKIYNKKNSEIFNFIPKLYSYVETNLGKGLETEFIKNYDGTPSVSLTKYIQTYGIDKDIKKSLKILYNQLLDNCVITRELKDFNIVISLQQNGNKKLYIIDGFGNQEFIPVSNYVKCLAKKKIKKHFIKFFKSLYTLF